MGFRSITAGFRSVSFQKHERSVYILSLCTFAYEMEKKHLASIKNFLASASVASVEPESCEVMLAKVQRDKPLSRLPAETNFGNDGKKLKLLKPHDQSVDDLECETNETIITCQRYGRIYRRRKQAHINIRSDGPPGTRWCRMCNGFKPLDAFYTKVKRYVCRKHHALRVYVASERRANAVRFDEARKDLRLAATHSMGTLIEAYDVLGYEQGYIDETDVSLLIQSSKLPLDLRPVVTPIDPTAGMWPHNIAIVSRDAFDTLVNMYQITNSRAIFIAMAQRCNLLPVYFDTSRPHEPYHNASYVRCDLDVEAVLQAEAQGGVPKTMDQTRVEEIESKGDVPWCVHTTTKTY